MTDPRDREPQRRTDEQAADSLRRRPEHLAERAADAASDLYAAIEHENRRHRFDQAVQRAVTSP